MKICAALFVLAWAVAPVRAVTRLGVEELKALVASSRAAGEPDQQTAARLANVEVTERFSAASFPADPGPRTTEALRFLAAASAFLKPPAAALPGDPPPAPSEQNALLAKARANTLSYVQNLPDFICTRTIRRYDDTFRAPSLHINQHFGVVDVTSSELTYRHGRESDQPQIVDRPTSGRIPVGLTSYGEFGSILAALFADQTGARMLWSHWEMLNGRRAAVFSYLVEKARSHYTVVWCCWRQGRTYVPRQVKAGYRGEIFVDSATGETLRVTRKALVPLLFPTYRADTMVEYQPVEIGGKSYLCPARSVTISASSFFEGGWTTVRHYLNEMLFTDYRKFVTSSTLQWTELHKGTWPRPAVPPAPPAEPATSAAVDKQAAPAPTEPIVPAVPDEPPLPAPSLPETPFVIREVNQTQEPEHFRQVRFSPDGQYVLAQDDTGINVLTVEPFRVLFRIPTWNATDAEFTPDSQEIVFISGAGHADSVELAYVRGAAHVERWSIADHSPFSSTAIRLDASDTVSLSPDGKVVVYVGFDGTLHLVDVLSGNVFFEKKKFGRKIENAETLRSETWGDPGWVNIDFSPDSRFVIVAPKVAAGTNPLAWDLRERRPVSLEGPLKDLRWAVYAFVAPDLLMMSYIHYGLGTIGKVSHLVAFPSGQVILNLRTPLPYGAYFRAADPGFILVRRPERSHLALPAVVQAVEFRTGHAFTKETSALDVFGEHYVMERFDGALEIYEHDKPRGLIRRDWPIQMSGRVLQVGGDRFVVLTDDHREVTLLVEKDTRFLKGETAIAFRDIQAGALVDVESNATVREGLVTTIVRLREGPLPVATAAAEASVPATETSDPHQVFLMEALDMATELGGWLPDYACWESGVRYRSDNHATALWRREDVVFADAVIRGGKKEYGKVTIDGQPGDPESVGNRTWSSGDYRSVLADVLDSQSRAPMKYSGEAKLGHFDAVGYAFRIDAEQSHWVAKEGGRTIRPVRIGTIWFDRKTKRVLRIEFRGVEIPRGFPTETMELALDYSYVQLGQEKFLVPTHAEQLGCRRAVAWCARNSIDLSNYRRLN